MLQFNCKLNIKYKGVLTVSLVLIVNINKSFTKTETARRASKDCDISRKSIKDMTIKYWSFNDIKNKIDDIVIVAGLKQGRICSAYKVKGYDIVNRIGKEGVYRERVEFFCDESYDDIVGLDLKDYVPLGRGGWTINTYDLDTIKSYVADQGESVKKNREELFAYYEEIGIPYNPEESYDYSQYYYGDKGSSYKRSETVRKKTHERSNYTCEYCGKSDCDLYCHHIELISEGGDDTIDNTMTVCYDCHKDIHSVDDYNESIKPKLQKLRLSKP